jgi:carnitine 3-dehydrogenase
VYRVAGGEGGMRHFMEQFGPSLKWPWTRFDGPELTDELLDRVTRQSDEQAGDMSIPELERLRDDCLVSVLQALRSNNYAAGKVLKRYEEQLYAIDHQAVMADESDDTINLEQPLILHHDTVRPEWVDYNNHMTESRYMQVFGDASDALFRYIGVDGDYHDRGFSYFTVETHMNFLREVSVDQPIHVGTQLLGGDDKRLHLFHTMYAAGDDTILATTEQMVLHVDTRQGKACSAEPEVQTRLNRLIEVHTDLATPEQAGRSIQPAR